MRRMSSPVAAIVGPAPVALLGYLHSQWCAQISKGTRGMWAHLLATLRDKTCGQPPFKSFGDNQLKAPEPKWSPQRTCPVNTLVILAIDVIYGPFGPQRNLIGMTDKPLKRYLFASDFDQTL